MSIPLDRLYHYIERTVENIHGDSVIIYRFFPHGSKKFTDLVPLHETVLSWKENKIRPQVFCNDQEPLNFDLYKHIPESQIPLSPVLTKIKEHGLTIPRKNFRLTTFVIWDGAVLLHSELRSTEVEKYKNCDFFPAFYWSHAVIALDWFRYAEHVDQQKNNQKLFLIYARGWTGTREYRLKFLESIIKNQLHTDCQTTIQPVDPELSTHYRDHTFLKNVWKPTTVLENYFSTNSISSEFSADFDLTDYETTEIEIVLETLFDDERLHFTEKILRPLALGQPFILVASHGGLDYLKQYGFKTFSDVWSEDYDKIQDPEQRLQAVVELMKSIKNWTHEQKTVHMEKARAIADYNKKRFFSKDFFTQVIDQLKSNLTSAINELQNTNIGQTWVDIREKFKTNSVVQNELLKLRSQQDTDEIYDIVLEHRSRNLNKLSDQLPS